MKPWVVLFLLLLAVGVAFGVTRDVFSREDGTLEGTVVDIFGGGSNFKSPPTAPPQIKVQLADGSTVLATGGGRQGASVGDRIRLTRWVTPWGQVWYTTVDS